MHDFRHGDIMPSLTIRHVTTYRYRQPVAFGEHRMMLRPRDSHDQRVIEASLEISPKARSLRFIQDAFGNHVGIARFSGRSKELCFESVVCLEHSPETAELDLEEAAKTFPVDYGADEMPGLAHCMERYQPDPENEVGRWAHQFLPADGSISPFELLNRVSQGIHHGFRYRRREAKGIQEPLETLRQLIDREPVPPRRLVPNVPRDLETVCLKCLQKDPQRRYGSAGGLADDLGRFVAGRPVLARPVGQVARAVRWSRRQPLTAALLAALSLSLFGGSRLS